MTNPPIIQGSPVPQSDVPLRGAMALGVTVFLMVMIISTAITYILPETYSSTARVKVGGDPYSLMTECEVIQSQMVLGKVVEKLNLNLNWGKKYFAGETLKTFESLKILKDRLALAPDRNAGLIAITTFSDDRQEAAQIANAIAAAYQEFCAERQKTDAAKSTDARVIADPVVMIIDAAEPAAKPCRPNKPLNLALGAALGLVLGAIAGGLLLLFRRGQNGP
jgi:uncharacterized protein involved in exopolysaccharide biosynthesis